MSDQNDDDDKNEDVDDVADAMLDGMMPAKPKPTYARSSKWGGDRYERAYGGSPYGEGDGYGYGRKISTTTRNGGTRGAAVHPSTTDRAGGYAGGRSHGQQGNQSQGKPLRETLPKMSPEDIHVMDMSSLIRRAGEGILNGLETQGYVLLGASESLMAKEVMKAALADGVRTTVERMIENDLIRDRFHDITNEGGD